MFRNIPGSRRVKRSLSAILFGLFCIPLGIILLFWNEGRTIKYYRALSEGQSKVMTIDPSKIIPEYEEQLVHFTGIAQTNDTVIDPEFGILENAIALKRYVEMYQWKYKKNNQTKDSTSPNDYQKEWSNILIDSDKFEDPDNHVNPKAFPYETETWYANKTKVEEIDIPLELVKTLNSFKDLELPKDSLWSIPSIPNSNNEVYIGKGNFENPEVGDVKVKFSYIDSREVSVVGKLYHYSLEPYLASNGKKVMLIEEGSHSAEAMFTEEKAHNKMLSWGFRLLGFITISFGFSRLFSPVSKISGMIPIAGKPIRAGIGIISSMLGAIISLIAISISWIYYRPLISVVLIVVILGLIFALVLRRKQKKQEKKASVQPHSSNDV